MCCSGAGNQGRLLVAALVDFWSGEAGGQAWEVGGWRLELGCSQEQARSCSTGVEKCRPSVPVSHRPSSKPESEHPVTPCIPGFAEKGQPGRDSGPITCFSPPRARHSTIRSSSCKTKARCELCCCKSRMQERSATQRRAERMSGRTGISRIFAVVCSFALAALQTPPTSACLPASLPVRKSALLLHRSFDNLTACIISGAEAPCQRFSGLCASRTLHHFLQYIPDL